MKMRSLYLFRSVKALRNNCSMTTANYKNINLFLSNRFWFIHLLFLSSLHVSHLFVIECVCVRRSAVFVFKSQNCRKHSHRLKNSISHFFFLSILNENNSRRVITFVRKKLNFWYWFSQANKWNSSTFFCETGASEHNIIRNNEKSVIISLPSTCVRFCLFDFVVIIYGGDGVKCMVSAAACSRVKWYRSCK